jgi:hypothetical protein
MKSTEIFKKTIQNYLEQRAASDMLFAASYKKHGKNIDECITCILNTVQKSGCNGFADDEIYSMAVHYYDEDNVDAGKPMNCHIAVNRAVELTEEEKEQARRDAIQQVHNEAYTQMKQPKKTPVKQTVSTNQLELF